MNSALHKDQDTGKKRRRDPNKKCARCNKVRPSYGYDDISNVWCKPCAEVEYEEQGIGEERRCDSQKKCARCKKVRSNYGYDDISKVWCKPCADIEYEDRGIREERRRDSQKKCVRCKKVQPNYGFDNTPSIWCKPCADAEYEDRGIEEERICDSTKKCMRCKKAHPSYGYDNISKVWCKPCADIEYEDRGIGEERRCDSIKKCGFRYEDGTSCPVQASSEKPFCARHDTSQTRRRKTKELKVVDFLRDEIAMPFLHNKAEYVDCSALRKKYYFPDIIWDCGSWYAHSEVDEEQHKTYTCECKRVLELAQSRLEVATLLIRYNPDAVHFDGTTWRYSEKRRKEILLEVVRWAMSDAGGEAARRAWAMGKLLAIYLFYDDMGCTDESGKWPGQIRYLSVDLSGNYVTEQVDTTEIGCNFH